VFEKHFGLVVSVKSFPVDWLISFQEKLQQINRDEVSVEELEESAYTRPNGTG